MITGQYPVTLRLKNERLFLYDCCDAVTPMQGEPRLPSMNARDSNGLLREYSSDIRNYDAVSSAWSDASTFAVNREHTSRGTLPQDDFTVEPIRVHCLYNIAITAIITTTRTTDRVPRSLRTDSRGRRNYLKRERTYRFAYQR